MPFALKLTQKGLILVLVPILFELFFVATLAGLLKQAEEGMIKENHSRAVMTMAHDLQKLFYDAGTAISFYKMTNGEIFKKRYFDAIQTKIPAHLEKFSALMKDEPFEIEAFKEISEKTHQGLAELENCRQRIEDGGNNKLFIVETRRSMEEMIAAIDKLVQKERVVQEQAPAAQAAARQTVVAFLYAGVGLSVFLGIALAVFFNSDIINRVKTMIANTRRVVKREPLLPRVSGKDEIAQLDAVFHEMTHALDEASKYKQDMLAMVSHDLRSPLMSVQVSLALLKAGTLGDLPAGAAKETAVAEANASRLIKMINELLDIERLEAGRFELDLKQGDLLEVLDRAIANVDALARARDVSINTPDQSVSLLYDFGRMEQVFTNVLSNAVKYSPHEGVINVEFLRGENFVEVRIADKGPGVPASKRETIFERFRQTDATGELEKGGSGLGLAIARALVLEHKGSIAVEENPGGGSILVLKLPT